MKGNEEKFLAFRKEGSGKNRREFLIFLWQANLLRFFLTSRSF